MGCQSRWSERKRERGRDCELDTASEAIHGRNPSDAGPGTEVPLLENQVGVVQHQSRRSGAAPRLETEVPLPQNRYESNSSTNPIRTASKIDFRTAILRIQNRFSYCKIGFVPISYQFVFDSPIENLTGVVQPAEAPGCVVPIASRDRARHC
jgi:hypothetical protein